MPNNPNYLKNLNGSSRSSRQAHAKQGAPKKPKAPTLFQEPKKMAPQQQPTAPKPKVFYDDGGF